MKEYLKTYWLVYLIIYLIKTFIIWKFTNPFQWVLDLPTGTIDYRVNSLGILISYSVFIWVIKFSINKSTY